MKGMIMASLNIFIFLCLLGLFPCAELANERKGGNEQYQDVPESYKQMETLYKMIGETKQLQQETNEFPLLFAKILERFVALEQKVEINNRESQKCSENYVDLLQSHRQLQHDFDVLNQKFTEHRREFGVGRSVGHDSNQNVLIEQNPTTTTMSNSIRNNNIHEKENVKSQSISMEKSGGQILQNISRVALTSCVYTDDIGPQPAGHIIKFSDIRTRVGIDSLSSFKTNGKFTCEVEGLYLVTLTFITTVRFGEVGLYKNGALLTRTFTTTDDGGQAYSSTVMAAVELQRNDTMWIQINYRTTLVYTYNWHELCLTIVKVA